MLLASISLLYRAIQLYNVNKNKVKSKLTDYKHTYVLPLCVGVFSEHRDILVFLTGQNEINNFITKFEQQIEQLKTNEHIFCVPCFANLPLPDQEKIFRTTPYNQRKVIVASNIAETSITIEGIGYVIDCCFVKIRCVREHIDELVVVPASKASCQQRAGRAGRLGPGKCYRMCTEKDYINCSPDELPPEIQRTNCAQFILQLKALGVRNLCNFEYIESPTRENFEKGLDLLQSLGAIDSKGDLTPDQGLQIVELGTIIEPKLATCLINSNKPEFKVCSEMMTIAALLSLNQSLFQSVNDPFILSKAKKKYGCTEGDHITLLNIFNLYQSKKQDSQKIGFAREIKMNPKALDQAATIKAQIKSLMTKKLGLSIKSSDDYDDPEAILKCMITGFFANVAQRQVDGNTYKSPRCPELVLEIHPSSVLCNIKPQWVLFSEIVSTQKQYMREVSSIKLEWLMELSPEGYYLDKRKQLAQKQHQDEIQKSNNVADKTTLLGKRSFFQRTGGRKEPDKSVKTTQSKEPIKSGVKKLVGLSFVDEEEY